MQKQCTQCSAHFEVTDEDLAFYDKVSPVFNGKKCSIPAPTLCPECRQQRRAACANQVNLYKRKCDFSGEDIVTNFHSTADYKVYKQKYWWSDKWDPMDYGEEISFETPFFEQFDALMHRTPHFAVHTTHELDENSEYTNYAGENKNCYLIFDAGRCEDCLYGYGVGDCTNCIDDFKLDHCEHCIECIDCVRCNKSAYLQNCERCNDSYFLYDCIGCSNCIYCANLRNKEYHINNQPVSKEEFEKVKATLQSREKLQEAASHFTTFLLSQPHRFMRGSNNEDILGNHLTNCKNAQQCFDGNDLWDCKYTYQGWGPMRDAMDTVETGESELMYETGYSGYRTSRLLFSSTCMDIKDSMYCISCSHSSHLFGCVGIRRKQYCILNKQYSKEEYEALVPKLIEYMKSTGEWGEFFPISISPFAYNESLAQELYATLTKEQALANGYKWRDLDAKNIVDSSYVVPDSIAATTDDITSEVLSCDECSSGYRVLTQELSLLRTLNMPVATKCFLCRHKARIAKRNPPRLFTRQCSKCQKDIQTSYAPERPEQVYCDECYLAEVY